jgi:DNA-binding response OmpR family regulator
MNAEHIMVVDDDADLRSALEAQLQANGYRVTGVSGVSEAMHATQHELPDLMILDLTLLDGDPFAGLSDGFAFFRLLRRNHPEANFPVIIYSGDHSPEVEARARTLGAFAVFEKGRTLDELLSAVRLALVERNAQPAAPAAGFSI